MLQGDDNFSGRLGTINLWVGNLQRFHTRNNSNWLSLYISLTNWIAVSFQELNITTLPSHFKLAYFYFLDVICIDYTTPLPNARSFFVKNMFLQYCVNTLVWYGQFSSC